MLCSTLESGLSRFQSRNVFGRQTCYAKRVMWGLASRAGTRFHPSGQLTQCGHCHSEDSAKGEGCQGDLRYAQVGVPYFLPIPHLARLCNESSLCAVPASVLLNPILVTRTARLRGSTFRVAPSSKAMRVLVYTMVSVKTSCNVTCTRHATTLVSLQTLRLLH